MFGFVVLFVVVLLVVVAAAVIGRHSGVVVFEATKRGDGPRIAGRINCFAESYGTIVARFRLYADIITLVVCFITKIAHAITY